MMNVLKNIVSETLDIYSLATLDGKLFIPFFIGCIYLLLSRKEEHDRARIYLVYPSLIILLIVYVLDGLISPLTVRRYRVKTDKVTGREGRVSK